MKIGIISTRSVSTDCSGLQFPVLDDKNVIYFLLKENTFHMGGGDLSPAFRKKKGSVRAPFLNMLFFEVPLAENHFNIKWYILGYIPLPFLTVLCLVKTSCLYVLLCKLSSCAQQILDSMFLLTHPQFQEVFQS